LSHNRRLQNYIVEVIFFFQQTYKTLRQYDVGNM